MGKKRDAIREVYNDCIEMQKLKENATETYDRGVYIQAAVILSILDDYLGEDYDYGR